VPREACLLHAYLRSDGPDLDASHPKTVYSSANLPMAYGQTVQICRRTTASITGDILRSLICSVALCCNIANTYVAGRPCGTEPQKRSHRGQGKRN
jgi:hypothetical protein